MANYESLKAAIQDVVKTNGNNEITGALLQQSLLAMINSLGAGYQFMGVAVLTPTATNPGTPDQNVFYIASEIGTYSNFGGLSVSDGEVAIFKYNGSWAKEVTGAATAAQVTQLGQELKYELTKADIITTGFLQSDGTLYSNANWGTTDYLPVYEIENIAFVLSQVSAQIYLCFYDSSKALVLSDNSYVNMSPSMRPVPEGAVYMRASFILSGSTSDNQYIRGVERTFRDQTNSNHNLLSKYLRGQRIYVSELWDDNLTRGFINDAQGNIYSNAQYRVSEYIPIMSGSIYIHLFSYRTSVYLAFYDSGKNLLLSTNYTSFSNEKIDAPLGTAFMRISMQVDHKTDSWFWRGDDSYDNNTISRGTIDKTIVNSSANNTQYVWFQVSPKLDHIDRIRFIASTGTINFFKVDTTTTPFTLTQITSVVNSASEHNTIKEIDVNVDLNSGEYIGVNGAFLYRQSGASGYVGGFVNSDGTSPNWPRDGFVLGIETICLLKNIVDGLVDSAETRIKTIDLSGNGDFTNIYDALKYTKGLDSRNNPITLLVKPGVYYTPTLIPSEFHTYCASRYLSIIGTDKVNCILRNDEGYYNATPSEEGNLGDNSVIKVSGSVYIANLTLIATDDNNESETNDYYHRSYCIHTDSSADEGSIMEIHNCNMINDHAPCVGFGIPKNCTLKITDCEMESDFYNPGAQFGGAVVYGHDRTSETGGVYEHLIVKNCIFRSSNGHAVKFLNNFGAYADCTFVGNACALPSGKGIVLGDNTSVIAPSFGNNIEAMNA